MGTLLVFRYASLQGKIAKKLLDPGDIESLDSIVLYETGKITRKSKAVFGILYHLGGIMYRPLTPETGVRFPLGLPYFTMV
jgi:predicted DCC family thiol-disulfide oxidoreductase YuxK